MRVTPSEVRSVLRLNAMGRSYSLIEKETGLSKPTLSRILKIAKSHNIGWPEAQVMSDEALKAIFAPMRRSRLEIFEPDWEATYAKHERKCNSLSLRLLWEEYAKAFGKEDGARVLSYQAFCRNYEAFTKSLPVQLKELSLTFKWEPGEVVQIDYCGDKVPYREPSGEQKYASVFVGVLANSGYIYCLATPDQKRVSWLNAQKCMFDFFGGVPKYVYLDNATSLVLRADKYSPKLCEDYLGFCSFHGIIPIAVRPHEPHDKALAENAVKQVQNRVLAPLQGQQFFGLDEVNKAMSMRLKELNDKPMAERYLTRREAYEAELPFLQKLPAFPWEAGVIEKILKVRKGYCVRVENRRVSVPWRYVGKQVKVLILPHQRRIEIFDLTTGERIAKHDYDTTKPGDTLIDRDHMPAAHVAVTRGVDELVELIGLGGTNSKAMAESIRGHNPTRVALKLLNGMLASSRRYGKGLLEKCCAAVLARPSHSYKALTDELDKCANDSDEGTVSLGPNRPSMPVKKPCKNVRGSRYYSNKQEKSDE